MSRRLGWLAAAAAMALASPASGYRLDEDGNGHPLHWSRMSVRYELVAGNSPAGAAGEEAVKRAFQSWSDASANVSYVFDGYASEGRLSHDRRNMVFWIYEGWPYDRNALAVTARTYSRSDGSLLDADIVFNGERHSWSVGVLGYDIENAAAHEVGHFGGLGHSTASEATMHASASPGETKKRTLADDDREGLNAIYGGVARSGGSGIDGAEDPASAGGVSATADGVGSGGGGGGCAITRSSKAGRSDFLWIASLGAFLALRRRASIRRRRGNALLAHPEAGEGRQGSG